MTISEALALETGQEVYTVVVMRNTARIVARDVVSYNRYRKRVSFKDSWQTTMYIDRVFLTKQEAVNDSFERQKKRLEDAQVEVGFATNTIKMLEEMRSSV